MGNVKMLSGSDKPAAFFSLATSKAYNGKDGNPVIETTWHNILAFEGKNIRDLQTLVKGDKVYVVGRIRNHKITGPDGVERNRDEVLASRVIRIDAEEPLSCEL